MYAGPPGEFFFWTRLKSKVLTIFTSKHTDNTGKNATPASYSNFSTSKWARRLETELLKSVALIRGSTVYK